MLVATTGEPVLLSLQLVDNRVDLYPRALVYNSSGSLIATLNLISIVGGLYQVNYTTSTEGYYTVVYRIYKDSSYTSQAPEYELVAESLNVNSIKLNILRLLGLTHDNTVVDNYTYDSDGNMTSARVRHYDSASNATTGGSTGLLHTWNIAATYLNDRLDTYKVVRI